MNIETGQVRLSISQGVAALIFDRPAARNAMTWTMYEQLQQICEQLATDCSVRVVTLRGAGGQAVVAGTDIAQFSGFQTGEDGVADERQIDRCIGLLEALPMPTIAVIEGWAVGGGLAIATACDFRIAGSGSRFGVPIARTLGNCLSVANLARMTAALGMQRVKRMLLRAEMLTADECAACGYLQQVCAPADLDACLAALCAELAALAPVTQAVSKEALRRLALAALPEGEDLIRRSYGSDDFHEGVNAFVQRRPPQWQGR